MEFKRTNIPDVIICQPQVLGDSRGYFSETFRKDKLESFLGYKVEFCQENESKSSFGVLRGLHYQLPPYAQTKLVSVLIGKVLDVAVDIRLGSPTFGSYVAVELSAENKRQLYIPRGFAHGFVVLSDEAVFSYKVDNYYNFEAERGIIYSDSFINIDWNIDNSDIKLSEKDKIQPSLENNNELFDYKVNYYA